MGKYEKAFIYFDTNALECRHSGKSLFLSQFTVTPLYYEIENIIESMGISNFVQICIPEVVWYEMQEHLLTHYTSEKVSMKTKIESFRKSFGNLAEIECTYKDCNTWVEYKDYVASIAQGFLDNPKITASIIDCPKDEDTIQNIIGQAVHSIKPFRAAKANGKEYTDAGFKDALIFNTIIKHTKDQLGIFITSDNDFEELFHENRYSNLRLCNNAKDVQTMLSDEFGVVTVDMIKSLLEDEYLCKRILTDAGFDENDTYKLLKINSCEMVDDRVETSFDMNVNGEKYNFGIVYSINANELIEATAEIVEEIEV